jgi:hypothetical protein
MTAAVILRDWMRFTEFGVSQEGAPVIEYRLICLWSDGSSDTVTISPAENEELDGYARLAHIGSLMVAKIIQVYQRHKEAP